MSLFTENEVRTRARQTIQADKLSKNSYAARSVRSILLESAGEFLESKSYDIFLSHSVRDYELVLGMRDILKDMGYSVYLDWFEDPSIDKVKVTSATANKLRSRMNRSKSLLYLTTENIDNSKWMPWECGFFDGLKEKVAIVPVKTTALASFSGKEYLSLYPWCMKVDGVLRIYKDAKTFTNFDNWIKTKNSIIQWKAI